MLRLFRSMAQTPEGDRLLTLLKWLAAPLFGALTYAVVSVLNPPPPPPHSIPPPQVVHYRLDVNITTGSGDTNVYIGGGAPIKVSGQSDLGRNLLANPLGPSETSIPVSSTPDTTRVLQSVEDELMRSIEAKNYWSVRKSFTLIKDGGECPHDLNNVIGESGVRTYYDPDGRNTPVNVGCVVVSEHKLALSMGSTEKTCSFRGTCMKVAWEEQTDGEEHE
ncbi:hypothetical protein ATI61_115193 [Archangium gephyra]|uniref:Uncharacterized protein n=1 Tax=Archangium gephyra TaxID=48 RepID=A0ABX9JQ78_9BACT|nr:hypothetical protein ATI61_115193 [Archangium gephyra]